MKICIHAGIFSMNELMFWSFVAISLKVFPYREEDNWVFWLLTTFIIISIIHMIIGDVIHLHVIYSDVRGVVSKMRTSKVDIYLYTYLYFPTILGESSGEYCNN